MNNTSKTLKDNIECIEINDKKYDTTGYFLLTTFDKKSEDITGHLCAYTSIDYNSLIAYLETFLFEIKQQYLNKINKDEALTRLMMNEAKPTSKDLN